MSKPFETSLILIFLLLAGDCGDPELPPGSLVEEGEAGRLEVTCRDGLHLNEEADPAGQNRTTLVCTEGAWNSTNLRCQCKFSMMNS